MPDTTALEAARRRLTAAKAAPPTIKAAATAAVWDTIDAELDHYLATITKARTPT